MSNNVNAISYASFLLKRNQKTCTAAHKIRGNFIDITKGRLNVGVDQARLKEI